jgi:hypothetical protein
LLKPKSFDASLAWPEWKRHPKSSSRRSCGVVAAGFALAATVLAKAVIGDDSRKVAAGIITLV